MSEARNPIELHIVGDDAYPPFSYQSDGEPKGLYVDILQAAFQKMPGYDVTITMYPYRRALGAVARGYAFAIFPPYRIKEREYIVRYSEPILMEEVYSVCSKPLQSGVTAWPFSHKGLSFAVNQGFQIGGEKFRTLVADGAIQVSRVASACEGLRMVLYGNCDCYINARLSIEWAAKQCGYDYDALRNRLKSWKRVSGETGHLGYGDSLGNPDLEAFMDQFDNVIRKMKQSGEIKRLVLEFMNR